jgi:hypothetical protein
VQELGATPGQPVLGEVLQDVLVVSSHAKVHRVVDYVMHGVVHWRCVALFPLSLLFLFPEELLLGNLLDEGLFEGVPALGLLGCLFF